MKNHSIINLLLLLLTGVVLTSCEKEEEVAQGISGAWEGDLGLTHIYHGETIKADRTIYIFNQESPSRRTGDGYIVEYYTNNHTELGVVYTRLSWETWTRQNGDVGIEIKFSETENKEIKDTKIHILKYAFDDKLFKGEYEINGQTIAFSLNRVTAPEVSNVKYWDYNELIPTWHQVTFSGKIYLEREYQGQKYYPKNVIITFDVDPAYNSGSMGADKAYIKEEYDNAPWGSYLADEIKFWDSYDISDDKRLNLYRSEGYDSYNKDYELMYIKFTDTEMKDEMFVKTNVFEPFTLKRVPNPDWSNVKLGFSPWIKK